MKRMENEINLLPPQPGIKFFFQSTRVGKICLAGLLGLLLLNLGLGGAYVWQLHQQRILTEAYQQIAGSLERVDFIADYKMQVERNEQQRKVMRAAHRTYLQWLNQIQVAWPYAVTATEVRLEPDLVHISGSAVGQGALVDLLQRLESDPYLRELMSLESELRPADGSVRFSLTYSWH